MVLFPVWRIVCIAHSVPNWLSFTNRLRDCCCDWDGSVACSGSRICTFTWRHCELGFCSLQSHRPRRCLDARHPLLWTRSCVCLSRCLPPSKEASAETTPRYGLWPVNQTPGLGSRSRHFVVGSSLSRSVGWRVTISAAWITAHNRYDFGNNFRTPKYITQSVFQWKIKNKLHNTIVFFSKLVIQVNLWIYSLFACVGFCLCAPLSFLFVSVLSDFASALITTVRVSTRQMVNHAWRVQTQGNSGGGQQLGGCKLDICTGEAKFLLCCHGNCMS